jgi:hypothetical protein
MSNKDHGFQLVHINKDEGSVLDDLQGGRSNLPNSNIRHYAGLEDHMHEIAPQMKQMYEAHARGGSIKGFYADIEEARKRGRNGDTEMVLLGPKARHCFNAMLNGGSVNPYTGCNEYWGFKKLWKGIKRGVRGVVKGAVNTVGKVAGIGSTAPAAEAAPQPAPQPQPVQPTRPQPQINPATGEPVGFRRGGRIPMNKAGDVKALVRAYLNSQK